MSIKKAIHLATLEVGDFLPDDVKLLCNFVKPTGSQKTSEIRYRENFWIKSLKNLDFTRV